MIVFAPHLRLWNVTRHVPWLGHAIIALSFVCAAITVVAVVAAWCRPSGVRLVVAIALGAVGVYVAGRLIAHVLYVPRPFVVHHFVPLFAHAADTSFPSTLTAYFAVAAGAMLCAWRPVGWVLAAVAFEIAAACVYVGVHYGTDVIAGAALGGVLGVVAWLVLGLPPLRGLIAGADTATRRLHLRPRPA